MVAIPSFHPGPFRRVGSSRLPYLIQKRLEDELGCVALVPHGPSGHESDIASQPECQRVLEAVLRAAYPPSPSSSSATPFMRAQRGEAKASCQIFGDGALITLTLAPRPMEDLPPELQPALAEEASRCGLQRVAVIDAHNSINGEPSPLSVMDSLLEAARFGLRAAAACPRTRFRVGAARVFPREFGVREGLGSGGIGVVVVEVEGRRAAYITIDGNNMLSGLRERILSEILKLGVEDGEVLTTDTHEVNGVTITPRGYHPIGERIPPKKVVDYVRLAVNRALTRLRPAEAYWREVSVPNVKVIGEKQIETLCLAVERAAQRAKHLALAVFPSAGLLATLLCLVL